MNIYYWLWILCGLVIPLLVLPVWFLVLCFRMSKDGPPALCYFALAGVFAEVGSVSLSLGWGISGISILGLLMGVIVLPLYNIFCAVLLIHDRRASVHQARAFRSCLAAVAIPVGVAGLVALFCALE